MAAAVSATDNYYDLGDLDSFVLLEFSCGSEEERLWLRRGLVWYYAFNHEEAIECYKKAITCNANSVMAFWGLSLCHGPNYNTASMSKNEFPSAKEAYTNALKAKELLNQTDLSLSSTEVALIEALQCRYNPVQETDDEAIQQNTDLYAKALKAVYKKFGAHPCIACLYAEALMNYDPWKLWNLDTGEAKWFTTEAKSILDCHLSSKSEVRHPGLHHLYIHLMEMSTAPADALKSCNILRNLCPDAGHLIHMPSHIYVLLGMWDEAATCNVEAQEADKKYLAKSGYMNCYTGYRIHNIHFIAYAAMFAANFGTAIRAAIDLRNNLPDDLISIPVMAKYFESYRSVDLHVYIRFGRWKEILDLPEYKNPLLNRYAIASLHYARGIAFAALGDVKNAAIERELLEASANDLPADFVMHNNTCRSLLEIAKCMLSGELLYRENKFISAFEVLRKAVQLSDDLVYDEPWGWMVPARHALGALLLEQNEVLEAENCFRKDMDEAFYGRCHPNNIWSMKGLVQCLKLKQLEDTGAAMQVENELKVLSEKIKQLETKSDQIIAVACLCANTNRDTTKSK